MELRPLIAALRSPAAYPSHGFAADAAVTVIETHISVVFLIGDAAFKLKKPLTLPFVDYSTRDRRRRFCAAEVALNRRLASDVYRGVVMVIRRADGAIEVSPADTAPDLDQDLDLLDREARGDGGELLDFMVEMRRLPSALTLEAWLARGGAPPPPEPHAPDPSTDETDGIDGTNENIGHIDLAAWWATIGRRLAAFHRDAASGPEIAAYARFEAVATNCRDNFSQTAELDNPAIPQRLLDRLAARTEAELSRQAPTIRRRAAAAIARDCHGDLRLDHLYLFPGRPSPAELEIVDCIEFNDAFRYSDPIADIAFLAMDLEVHGHPTAATDLLAAYLEASGDREGAALLPLYIAYRAAVRGKVEAIRASQGGQEPAARRAAETAALRHFLLALRTLSPPLTAPPTGRAPLQGPALLLVAGLPGVGKSSLARSLVGDTSVADPQKKDPQRPQNAGEHDSRDPLRDSTGDAIWIRSDRVRKRLAGLREATSAAAPPGAGIYSPAWTARTYATCLTEAREHLATGALVVVDANFKSDAQRQPFADLAANLGVPFALLICVAPEAIVRQRLAQRRGDASDADQAIYEHARREWEEPAPALSPWIREIATGGPEPASLQAALDALRGLPPPPQRR